MSSRSTTAREEFSLSTLPRPRASRHTLALTRIPLCYWGIWALLIGLTLYFSAILLSILRLLLLQRHLFVDSIASLLWASGFPTTIGIVLIALDLAFLLPLKRRGDRYCSALSADPPFVTVALTAYNDE